MKTCHVSLTNGAPLPALPDQSQFVLDWDAKAGVWRGKLKVGRSYAVLVAADADVQALMAKLAERWLAIRPQVAELCS